MDVREKLVELLKEIVAIQECSFGDPRPTYETVASYLIYHGVTVQEWISVKDRLPKSMDWVLCICADGKFHILRYDYISGDWDIYNKNNCCYGEWFVTHWMPLPQPPKGE